MRRAAILAAAGMAMTGAPALAHHSVAAVYDRDRPIELHGVLSKLQIQNPHSTFELIVAEPSRARTVWTLEGRGVAGMIRDGFVLHAVEAGDKVTVKGAPSRQGLHQLWLNSLQADGGKLYEFGARTPLGAPRP